MSRTIPKMPKSGPKGMEMAYYKDMLGKIFKVDPFVETLRAILKKNKGNPPTQYTGVPQGSNLGPTLAILVLKEFLQQQESLSYADDGLFFSNQPFEIKGDM